MGNLNYQSSAAVIRNLADVPGAHEVVWEEGRFRIVQFALPYFGGYEYWIVNEKGFLWEPADTLDDAEAYLKTDEAMEYQREG